MELKCNVHRDLTSTTCSDKKNPQIMLDLKRKVDFDYRK